MVRLQIRRRRFLILAQGWSASDNPGYPFQNTFYTLKGLDGWRTLTGFQFIVGLTPRVLAALEPWAKISERLRRIFKLNKDLKKLVLYPCFSRAIRSATNSASRAIPRK